MTKRREDDEVISSPPCFVIRISSLALGIRMPRRLAASLSLLVFAICLIAGIDSGNTLSTVLSRALVAMAGTLVVSMVIGAMGQRMLDENVAKKEDELRQLAAMATTDGLPAIPPVSKPVAATKNSRT